MPEEKDGKRKERAAYMSQNVDPKDYSAFITVLREEERRAQDAKDDLPKT